MRLKRSSPKIGGALEVFLREADDRIADYQASRQAADTPLFVPCDFLAVYSALHVLRQKELMRNRTLCEWGSGFGVVTCMAAMLGFDACGIEIEPDLVEQAERLAQDFGWPVEFYCGSFIPDGFPLRASDALPPPDAIQKPVLSLKRQRQSSTYLELGLDMKDYGVIFGYPWPGEENLIERLFDTIAAPGSILITYHGVDELRFRQKETVAGPHPRIRNR